MLDEPGAGGVECRRKVVSERKDTGDRSLQFEFGKVSHEAILLLVLLNGNKTM